MENAKKKNFKKIYIFTNICKDKITQSIGIYSDFQIIWLKLLIESKFKLSRTYLDRSETSKS